MKKLMLALCVMSFTTLSAHYKDIYSNHRPVKIYQTHINRNWINPICASLEKFDVKYKKVSSFVKDDNSLYLIAHKPPSSVPMPRYYIWVQTREIKELDAKTEEVMHNAVAVWDANWKNIAKYKESILHYYYMPNNYQYADPVILPCFLPSEALDGYKIVLQESNKKQLDFSNHLPAIYVHTYLQKPKQILELGVASGQATDSFYRAAAHSKSKMTGVDIDPQWVRTYDQYKDKRMTFYGISDLEFIEMMHAKSEVLSYDIIFIDTSHYFEHTKQELFKYGPYLNPKGMWILHDSNMSPLKDFGWTTLNNVISGRGWDNERGVARAIQKHFNHKFNESKYYTATFRKFNLNWKLIHYPFCNGLTIIKKI